MATWVAVVVVGLAWIGVARPTARADKPSEVSVKAAFVVSFLKFIEWPPTPTGTPIVLVVIGAGPMADALKSGTDGLQIGGRPVHMRLAQQPNDVDAADAVFIAASQQRHVASILRQLERRAVLTIGDGEGYAASGVVLNLVIQDDRVRVEANTAAAARAGLRVSDTQVATRLYIDHMGYDGVFPGTGRLNMDTTHGLWLGGEAMASRRVGRRHRVTTGIEYRANLQQNQDNWDAATGDFYVHDVRSSQQSALFVQDELTLSRHWTATLGARWDWWSLGPGSLRPRAGLVYRTEGDLAIKFLYGEAFRAANTYELFYTETSSAGNPDLRPERLSTSEVVFEQYLSGRVRLTAAGFVTRIHDLIDQDDVVDGPVRHVNRGSAGATGVEAEAEYRSAGGVLARGSVVAQRATDGDTGEPLSNSPEHLATLQLAVPLVTREVTLALDANFVGTRMSRLGRELDEFWLANLTTTWQPRHSALAIQGGIQNLFDTMYAHPVGSEFRQDAIAQDGRTAWVRMGVRF